LLTEWELWAVADATLKLHRERAPLFVATRIGALAAEGDVEGVAAWQAIARRMGALSAPPRNSDA
jgi:hypothetical protein